MSFPCLKSHEGFWVALGWSPNSLARHIRDFMIWSQLRLSNLSFCNCLSPLPRPHSFHSLDILDYSLASFACRLLPLSEYPFSLFAWLISPCFQKSSLLWRFLWPVNIEFRVLNLNLYLILKHFHHPHTKNIPYPLSNLSANHVPTVLTCDRALNMLGKSILLSVFSTKP